MSAHGAFTPRPAENFTHTGLRGIAAMAVVGSHAIRQAEIMDPGLGSFLQSSYLFVDLFFMLSGFIMVETYASRLRTGPFWYEARRFLQKRAVKILPNYYVWLFLGMSSFIVVDLYTSGEMRPLPCLGSSVFYHVFMVQHFADTCVMFNFALWSIATEMFVYLVFPAFVLVLRGWLALLIGAVLLYALLFAGNGTIDLIYGGASVVRTVAGFVIGGIVASLYRKVPDQISQIAQVPLMLGLVVVLMWQIEAAALVLMALIVMVTARNVGPLWRVAQWFGFYVLGRASFSIYLAHIPIMILLVLIAAKIEVETGVPFYTDWHFFVVINLVVSGTAGVLVYRMIEHRFETWFRPPPSTKEILNEPKP